MYSTLKKGYIKDSNTIFEVLQWRNVRVRLSQFLTWIFNPFLLFAVFKAASNTYYGSRGETTNTIVFATMIIHIIELVSTFGLNPKSLHRKLRIFVFYNDILPESFIVERQRKGRSLLNGGRIDVSRIRLHLYFSYVVIFISVYMAMLRKMTMEEPFFNDVVALFGTSVAYIYKSKCLLTAEKERSTLINFFETHS